MAHQPGSAPQSVPLQRAGDRALAGATFGYRMGNRFPDPAAQARATELMVDPCGVTVDRLRYEEEQSYYNELYLLAPVGYFLVGFDSTILQVNLVGADMLGIARARPGEHHFRAFVTPSFLPDFDALIGAALNSQEPHTCRLQMACEDGDAFPVTLLASADGSGQACRVVVERAEGKMAALERSEERFRRIVHSAEEGIWEIDALSCTSFVNPKMSAMLGYAIEDMLGKPLVAFMDEEGKSILERNIARRQAGIAERHEFKFVRQDGHPVWTTMATNPIFDAAGHYMGALALVTDITETRASTELIWQQANFDALTGLPNRHMFMDRLKLETRKADRNATFLALLFIDLDHFKEVNDRLGHAKGDMVLVEATRRIASCVRTTDTLARLGGDEFTVILTDVTVPPHVHTLCDKILTALNAPFRLKTAEVSISGSIGITLYPQDAGTTDELVRHADAAMYAAKNAGRSCYRFFADLA